MHTISFKVCFVHLFTIRYAKVFLRKMRLEPFLKQLDLQLSEANAGCRWLCAPQGVGMPGRHLVVWRHNSQPMNKNSNLNQQHHCVESNNISLH